MPLSADQLEDFITSYENAFNERLTPDQANELFDRLLDLYARIKRVSDESDDASGSKAPDEDQELNRHAA
jgi:hypothetical protein